MLFNVWKSMDLCLSSWRYGSTYLRLNEGCQCDYNCKPNIHTLKMTQSQTNALLTPLTLHVEFTLLFTSFRRDKHNIKNIHIQKQSWFRFFLSKLFSNILHCFQNQCIQDIIIKKKQNAKVQRMPHFKYLANEVGRCYSCCKCVNICISCKANKQM